MATREDFLSLFQTTSRDKLFINYYITENTGFAISWKEFHSLTERLYRFLLKLLGEHFEYVGIILCDFLWLPCLLLSIWKSGKACACIGTQYSEECNLNFLNTLHVKYLITDSERPRFNAALVRTFQICSQKLNVWRRNLEPVPGITNKPLDICYGIMTSGSTGSPKTIQVPWSCILPNVYELIDFLSVNESDNVYLSSPYTFDPFFIELFMSMVTGCLLTIVSPYLKISYGSLSNIFFTKQEFEHYDKSMKGSDFCCKTSKITNPLVTVLQMTPSVFRRWGADIKNTILADSSPLRTLLLGGEKFSVELLKAKSENNKTKIYNIYGITEISCWAFINCITDNCREVSLGKPLKNILYKVEDGVLYLGSKERRCIIDTEQNIETNEVTYRNTGDVVKVKDNEIYYLSRSNQIVKKFGIKINLEKIENLFLKSNNHIEECFCIFDEDTMKSAVFYINKDLSQDFYLLTEDEMKNINHKNGLTMRSIEIPDYIVQIKKQPLNCNGKCDKNSLKKLFKDIMKSERTKTDVEKKFKKVWTNLVGKNNNFLLYGGDSVKALQMIMKLEDDGIEVYKDFLPTLLKNGDYESCLAHVAKTPKLGRKRIKLNDEGSYNFLYSWKFDTKKCVDATPTVFHHNSAGQVIVGSHSSRLSSVKIDTGQENWTINLGDRIESGLCVNKSSTFGVIGCYDHHVYCISIDSGEILWMFLTGGIIKSTPFLSCDEKNVFVASYDTYLYRLDCSDGSLLRKVKLGDRGVYSTGILWEEMQLLYIGTLDGSCISLTQNSNEISWKHGLKSPIFASPILIINDRKKSAVVIFAEVTGRLNSFAADTGKKVWSYDSNGCIYSTPVYSPDLNVVIFASYDNHIYCLNFCDEPTLRWKVETDSPVFGKPSLYTSEDTFLFVTATTKGWLYLHELNSGLNLNRKKLDGEIFSSPKIFADNLVIGCRDNNLYCFKIVKQL